MGDSLRVYSPVPVDLKISVLFLDIERTIRILLHQPDNFRLDLDLLNGSGNGEQSISPDGKLHTIAERRILASGVTFYYELDKYWSMHSEVPLFEFALVEVPRRDDDMCLVLCLAISIAVARAFSATHIVDGNGVWATDPDSDLISLENLFKLAIDKPLPFDVALQSFYGNLPCFN